jgi:hypothetical protein
MHPRPNPEFFYKKAVQKYESQFRRKIPQWVKALGNSNVRALVGVSTRLGWKLPPKILVEGEQFSGPESLWADRQIRVDFFSESRNRGVFVPKDLQDLPIDPAEAAALGSIKKGKRKWGK